MYRLFILFCLLPLLSLADPNDDLRNAILHRDLPKVNQAIAQGANPLLCDDYSHNWIHLAVLAGFAEAIEPLSEAGVPFDGVNDVNHTPAHLAEARDQKAAKQILKKLSVRSVPDLQLRMSPDPSRGEAYFSFMNLLRCFGCGP